MECSDCESPPVVMKVVPVTKADERLVKDNTWRLEVLCDRLVVKGSKSLVTRKLY